MRPAVRLFQEAASLTTRITFFTRANCSLCENAKKTLSNVWDSRPFAYKEIDVMKPEGMEWRALYEFDTPVIHISSSKQGEERTSLAGKAVKLMHRFTEEQVKSKMDIVDES
ncbi:hypothetical protein B0O99DRAFT_505389 [Bisporella sp. PMI_857]|nr:hypothetical protein B0O99DRAFT_505389 [Bisporella sp. PMI_857]